MVKTKVKLKANPDAEVEDRTHTYLLGRSNSPVVTIFAGGLKAGADAG